MWQILVKIKIPLKMCIFTLTSHWRSEDPLATWPISLLPVALLRLGTVVLLIGFEHCIFSRKKNILQRSNLFVDWNHSFWNCCRWSPSSSSSLFSASSSSSSSSSLFSASSSLPAKIRFRRTISFYRFPIFGRFRFRFVYFCRKKLPEFFCWAEQSLEVDLDRNKMPVIPFFAAVENAKDAVIFCRG